MCKLKKKKKKDLKVEGVLIGIWKQEGGRGRRERTA
jgi:hypothetical protein